MRAGVAADACRRRGTAQSRRPPDPELRGLPPVLGRRTRVLVLGSFPGAASLAARQYYAHPRNHFWPLVAAVIGAPLAQMHYRERLRTLRAQRIGLWDVIVSCRRRGSLDGAIRMAVHGEVARAQRIAPALALVCFNGKTAARALPAWREAGYATLVLPSSSPAYTRPFEEKLACWRAIGEFLRLDAREEGR
jgi:hypoxanthine-DNA glycosylase